MQTTINTIKNEAPRRDHLATIANPEMLDEIFDNYYVENGGSVKPVFAVPSSCTGVPDVVFEPIHLPMW